VSVINVFRASVVVKSNILLQDAHFIFTAACHPMRAPVLYQVLNKQVPVPVPVIVVQVQVQVPVPNLQVPVPVPVQVLCMNYRHSVTLQLHQVKVVVSFIFKKRTSNTNQSQPYFLVLAS